jgi:hypothetical protein
MAASSAPAAKASLITILTAASGMAGVQIEYSHPGASIQQESVFFGRTFLDEVAGALGQQRRNESYALELVVSVAQDGDNAQVCEERCWALVAVVENALRPPTGATGAVSANLAGAVNLWAVLESVEMTPTIEGGQRIAEAVCMIRCQHRK